MPVGRIKRHVSRKLAAHFPELQKHVSRRWSDHTAILKKHTRNLSAHSALLKRHVSRKLSDHSAEITKHVSQKFSTHSALPDGYEALPGFPPSFTSVYGLSSWTYALLGFGALFLCWESQLYPGMHLEALAAISQSVFSFGCDVLTFGRASRWKVADRVHATLFFLVQVAKLLWLEMTFQELALWVVVLGLGAYCFKGSAYHLRKARDTKEEKHFRGFLRWHTAWHFVLPAGVGLWMYLRYQNLSLNMTKDFLADGGGSADDVMTKLDHVVQEFTIEEVATFAAIVQEVALEEVATLAAMAM